MSFPTQVYISLEDFKKSYLKDKSKYLKKLNTHDELDFLSFLMRRYELQNEYLKNLKPKISVEFHYNFVLSLNFFPNEENSFISIEHKNYLKEKCFISGESILFNDIEHNKLCENNDKILKYLEKSIFNYSNQVKEIDLDFIKNYIWGEKFEKFIDDYYRFSDYYEKNKTFREIIYFLKYVVDYDYFLPLVNGQKIAPRHYKQFIAYLMQVEIKSINHAYKKYFSQITRRNNHFPAMWG